MSSKDEILADFQACSGIDDVGEAFTRLEAADWNLAAAVNSYTADTSSDDFEVIPHELLPAATFAGGTQPSFPCVSVPWQASDVGGAAMGEAQEGATGGASSSGQGKEFHIQVQVDTDIPGRAGKFPLEVKHNTTIRELKSTLYSILGISVCNQKLNFSSSDAVTDDTILTPGLIGPTNVLIVSADSDASTFVSSRRDDNSSHSPDIVEVKDFLPRKIKDSSKDKLGGSLSNSLAHLPSTSNSYFDNSYRNSLSSNSSSSSKKPSTFENHSNKHNNLGARKKHTEIVDISDDPDIFVEDEEEGNSVVSLLVEDVTHTAEYQLQFPNNRTVGSIKQDVYAVTKIPVHKQSWSYWPKPVTDSMTLAQSGVGHSHRLAVREKSPTCSVSGKTLSNNKKGAKQHTSDSSSEEFEDASEYSQDEDDSFLDMMDTVPTDTKVKSLLAPSLESSSEVECVDRFVQQFTARFASPVPFFFQGPFSEAIEQSVMLSPQQRRLLALYVHDDHSVTANVFCSEVLCNASIITYFTDNFVLWGWDITHQVHKERLVNIINTHVGSLAGLTVRNFRSEQLPAIVVLNRNHGANEVMSVIYSSTCSLNEVMASLVDVVELFEKGRMEELAKEQERLHRQAIMDDQDAAYQESLRADRAKAELKRMQEIEQEMEEKKRQYDQRATEELRALLEAELPPEPTDKDASNVTTMRFRVPGGEQFTRAFCLDTTLQVVLNFLLARGFAADHYKFLQSWPRRDISSLNVSKTLREYNIPTQETITIEER